MDSRENKQVADKIDSLDYLPEGYNPNIASKWKLLESALEQPATRNRKRFAWFSIAAGLILLMGITALWFYLSSPMNVNALRSTPPLMVFSPTKTKSPVKAPTMAGTKPQAKKYVLKRVKKISSKTEAETIQPQVADALHDIEKLPVSSETKPATAGIMKVVGENTNNGGGVTIAKRKSPRYVQVDFDSPLPTQPPILQNQTGIAFRMKLFQPDNTSPALTESFQNTAAIKFKPGF